MPQAVRDACGAGSGTESQSVGAPAAAENRIHHTSTPEPHNPLYLLQLPACTFVLTIETEICISIAPRL